MAVLSDNAAVCLDASVTFEASGNILSGHREAVSSSTYLPESPSRRGTFVHADQGRRCTDDGHYYHCNEDNVLIVSHASHSLLIMSCQCSKLHAIVPRPRGLQYVLASCKVMCSEENSGGVLGGRLTGCWTPYHGHFLDDALHAHLSIGSLSSVEWRMSNASVFR